MNQTQTHVRNCLAAVDSVVLGKAQVTRLAFATLLARGSILIEDRPGIGKTTLAKALASVLGLSFQRIQCTNDLLPMDILGRLDYTHSASPGLIKGPIFAGNGGRRGHLGRSDLCASQTANVYRDPKPK